MSIVVVVKNMLFDIVCIYKMINCKGLKKSQKTKIFKDYHINSSLLTPDWESSAVALWTHIFVFLKYRQLVILVYCQIHSWSISCFFFLLLWNKVLKEIQNKEKIRSKWKKSYVKNYIWGWGGSQRLLKVIVFFKSINCIINHCRIA